MTDQSKLEKRERPGERPIREEELTFTDTSKPNDRIPDDAYRVVFNVVSRTRPDRRGAPVQPLAKGQLVRWIGNSKDGHWTAIQIYTGNQPKSWVPKNAVKKAEVKAEKPKAAEENPS